MNDLCLGELTLTVINCEKTEEITKAIQEITEKGVITSEEAIEVAIKTKATELADFLSLFNKIYCSYLHFEEYLSHIAKHDRSIKYLPTYLL